MMDLLRTAVVDITTLAATCHALMSSPIEGALSVQRKLRQQLRRELKRGTVAYIDALSRTRRELVDDTLLAACRMAAEQHMERAIRHQGLLGRIMASEPGALEGLAASRQDLWRLAHMAIYLRVGTAGLQESGASIDSKSVSPLASRLRRRFRKALIAYARAILRTREPKGRLIATAREESLAKIGKRGAAEAERLSDIEAGSDSTLAVIRLGVAKPLLDLALDWQRRESAPSDARGGIRRGAWRPCAPEDAACRRGFR